VIASMRGNMIDSRAASAGVEEYRAFPSTKVQAVPVRSIKERPQFQARDLGLVDARSVRTVANQRADLIASIRRDLEADPAHSAEPIWVARIGTELCVVDGFHRLRAFTLAGRQKIPARVRTMPQAAAVVVSLQVNEGDRRLPRARGERTEAAWQFIGAITERGTRSAPGWTQKRIAEYCNLHVNTVAKMQAALRRCAGISLSEYKQHELNKQTGWITWHAACTHGRTFADETPQFTNAEQQIIEQARRKLGGIIEKWQQWASKQPIRCIDAAFERIAQEHSEANEPDLAADNLLVALRLPEDDTVEF